MSKTDRRAKERKRWLQPLKRNMRVTLPYIGIVHCKGQTLQMHYNKDWRKAKNRNAGSGALGWFLC